MRGRIFSIDPGSEKSAFVLYDSHDKVILDKGILPNEDLLHRIKGGDAFSMAIEMIASYGMPVGKDVFETCIWIGRFIQAVEVPVTRIYRKDVKMFLCGNMRAKDSNIRQALLDLLGKEATKGVSKDMWAALGVAVTFADSSKMEETCKIADEVL